MTIRCVVNHDTCELKTPFLHLKKIDEIVFAYIICCQLKTDSLVQNYSSSLKNIKIHAI